MGETTIKKTISNGEPITAGELYEYIQIAERDEFGFHVINQDIHLHIYSGEPHTQVNVHHCSRPNYNLIPTSNIIFDIPEKIARVYKVSSTGTVNYDKPYMIYRFDESFPKYII